MHLVLCRERLYRRGLRKNLLFDERDQMLVELLGRYLCHLKELLIGDDRVLIEQKQEEHLVGRAEEFITFTFFECSTDLGIAKSKFPVKTAATVELRVVKLGESVHGSADFLR